MTETIEETSQNETTKATWGNIDEHTVWRGRNSGQIVNQQSGPASSTTQSHMGQHDEHTSVKAMTLKGIMNDNTIH